MPLISGVTTITMYALCLTLLKQFIIRMLIRLPLLCSRRSAWIIVCLLLRVDLHCLWLIVCSYDSILPMPSSLILTYGFFLCSSTFHENYVCVFVPSSFNQMISTTSRLLALFIPYSQSSILTTWRRRMRLSPCLFPRAMWLLHVKILSSLNDSGASWKKQGKRRVLNQTLILTLGPLFPERQPVLCHFRRQLWQSRRFIFDFHPKLRTPLFWKVWKNQQDISFSKEKARVQSQCKGHEAFFQQKSARSSRFTFLSPNVVRIRWRRSDVTRCSRPELFKVALNLQIKW